MVRFAFVFFLFILCNDDFLHAEDLPVFPKDSGAIVLSKNQAFTSILEKSVGNYNNEPISIYSEKSIFTKLGRPVGRLDVTTNVSKVPCTGFLVSKNYVLTNYHCVSGLIDKEDSANTAVSRIDEIHFVLGYTKEGVEENALRFKLDIEPVEENKNLDYAILKVNGDPAVKFGTVKLSSDQPYENQPFLIIGHPLGSSQRISREKCLSADPAVSGDRIRHKCDTLPGNSGSPVFDQDTRKVIGLHHAGSSRLSINFAIPMSLIAANSPIIKSIINSYGTPIVKEVLPKNIPHNSSKSVNGVTLGMTFAEARATWESEFSGDAHEIFYLKPVAKEDFSRYINQVSNEKTLETCLDNHPDSVFRAGMMVVTYLNKANFDRSSPENSTLRILYYDDKVKNKPVIALLVRQSSNSIGIQTSELPNYFQKKYKDIFWYERFADRSCNPIPARIIRRYSKLLSPVNCLIPSHQPKIKTGWRNAFDETPVHQHNIGLHNWDDVYRTCRGKTYGALDGDKGYANVIMISE